jgi:cytochrome bd-type quinol oxidase subunit 2
VLAAFVVFVAVGLVKPILILFGAVDFGGGVWTFQSMKKDRRSRRKVSRI